MANSIQRGSAEPASVHEAGEFLPVPWVRSLHRVTGLGVLTFLVLHIVSIWLAGLGPEPFNTLAWLYRHPAARVLHLFLFFSVLFHAVNGARMIILDFWPALQRRQRASIWVAAVLFLAVFIPSSLLILMDAFLPA
jgi:succinate dehydrogenase / fumarate reductase cytochrome b subunit